MIQQKGNLENDNLTSERIKIIENFEIIRTILFSPP